MTAVALITWIVSYQILRGGTSDELITCWLLPGRDDWRWDNPGPDRPDPGAPVGGRSKVPGRIK